MVIPSYVTNIERSASTIESFYNEENNGFYVNFATQLTFYNVATFQPIVPLESMPVLCRLSCVVDEEDLHFFFSFYNNYSTQYFELLPHTLSNVQNQEFTYQFVYDCNNVRSILPYQVSFDGIVSAYRSQPNLYSLTNSFVYSVGDRGGDAPAFNEYVYKTPLGYVRNNARQSCYIINFDVPSEGAPSDQDYHIMDDYFALWLPYYSASGLVSQPSVALPLQSWDTTAYTTGYNNGYNAAFNAENPVYSAIQGVFDGEIRFLTSLTNFDFLGFNLFGFLTGVLTICLGIAVGRFVWGFFK